MSTMKSCSMCDFIGTCDAVIHHVIRTHEGHPLFAITCDACGGSWKKYESFRKHVSRKHPDMLQLSSNTDHFHNVTLGANAIAAPVVSRSDHIKQMETDSSQQGGAYLLHLKSVHGLSQTGMDDIVSQTSNKVKLANEIAAQKLLELVEQHEQSKDLLAELDKPSALPVFSLFDGMKLVGCKQNISKRSLTC